jgi:hypothetical protein
MTQTRRMTSIRHNLFVAVLAVVAASCSSNDSTSPVSGEAGTYTLTTVDGQAPPFSLTSTTLNQVVIQSATITLTPGNPSSTYTASVSGTINGSPTTTLISDTGTYTVSGATLSFSSTTFLLLTYGGSFTNNTLTVSLPGQAFGGTGTLVLGLSKS